MKLLKKYGFVQTFTVLYPKAIPWLCLGLSITGLMFSVISLLMQ